MDKFCVWDLWAMNSEGVGGKLASEWVGGWRGEGRKSL